MQWVATQNLSAADHLLLRPSAEASAYLKGFGRIPLTPLTHYLAGEQNRLLFESWGTVQLGLSVAFFLYLLFGTRMGKMPVFLALALVLLAVAERLVVIPGMNLVGRATDFAVDPSHKVRLAGAAVNFGYTAAEIVKWLLAAAVAAFLLFEHTRRSFDSGKQFDMVDKANYRHIDR